MQNQPRLEATVRNLIDPSTFGHTESQLRALREQEAREERWLDERGLPPRSKRRSGRFPWIEPRLRSCFVPPSRWQERRRDLFRFLEGKPDRRRAEPTAAHWRKLSKALEAKASGSLHDLEKREMELSRQRLEDEAGMNTRLLKEVADQIGNLRDLPAWKVRWLVGLLEHAVTEESLMGAVERTNQRRAGLEFELDSFELPQPPGVWEPSEEPGRVRFKPERTDLGARWALMLTLTGLGLGVDVSSKIAGDLLLWFGIEEEKKGKKLWPAIKQWWICLEPHYKG